jgi:hypothetical protein
MIDRGSAEGKHMARKTGSASFNFGANAKPKSKKSSTSKGKSSNGRWAAYTIGSKR